MYGLPEIHTRIECEDLLEWARKDVREAYKAMMAERTHDNVQAYDRAAAKEEYLQELLGCLVE